MEIFLRRFSLSLLVSTIIISSSLLSGCSVGSFIGAYFNTYYNAQKAFIEAETEVLTAAAGVPGSRTEKPYLAPFDVPAQTKTKFTTVIEKCSKLLQYHPESSLVDDALLMIGKSHYYQNEHQSAERKFKELLTTQPESDLVWETRLLLANTYYRNNDKPTAATAARELLDEARQENEDGIVSKSARLLAQIEVEAKNYLAALEYFQLAADFGETSEERAAAYRSVAEMYVQQHEYSKAAEAYLKSEDVSSDYVSRYRGEIGYARMLSKLGRHEESLAQLEELVKNANYREFFGEVDLEIANVYRDQKDFASAEQQYRYVDTAYARTEAAANSYYQLGLMYEMQLNNYDSARVAYEKGKGEFPSAEITPTITRRSDAMNRYFTHRTEIVKWDSVLQFIMRPPDTSAQSATEDSLLKKTAVLDSLAAKNFVQDSTKRDSVGTKLIAKTDTSTTRAPVVPPPPLDTVRARLAFSKSELAGLFYSSLERIDSAKYWYARLLNDHPNSSYAPRAMYTLTQINRQDSSIAQTSIDSVYKQIVDRFPESEFAAESRRLLGLPPLKRKVDSTETSFTAAEALVKKGDYANALKSFKGITEKDTTSALAAKAQYTIGWIYENVKSNTDSSVANYQRLVKRFPSSQYVSLVQPKLAEVEAEKQKKLQELELEKQKKQQEAEAERQKKLQEAAKDSSALQKTEDELKKDESGRVVPPGVKDVLKDSLNVPNDSLKNVINDEVPIRKSPPKKDDDPKP